MKQNTDPFDFFGRSTALPGDVHTAQEGEAIVTDQSGRRPMQALHRGDKGVIIEQFPGTHSYTVQTERSGKLRGVLRIAQSPGDKKMLPEGTQVCVTHEFGPPMIVGVLNYTVPIEAEKAPTSITGVEGTGADDAINPTDANANFRSNSTPRDLSPNDSVEIGPMGNVMGVLDGGVNVMKSTDFAQIRTHLVNDLVEILSDKFRHFTSMGFSEVKNDGGRASYVFRGGTDQLHEAGSDQENWTIRLDLGGTGDLFKFELTEPDGTAVFRIHVTPDGKADLYAAKGFNWKEGEQGTKKSLKDEETEVKGAVKRTIGGEETRKVRGARKTSVSSNDSKSVGNDGVESYFRHFTKSVGGDAKYTFIGGNPAVAKPTNEALTYEIVNGSWKVNIGDPLSGGSPAAVAGFDLQTFLGSIGMKVKTAGNVDFSTELGNATLETQVGLATLKTGLGIANVDGTTVNLGPVAASFANPIIKGTLHTTAMSTYLGANTAAYTALSSATAALITALTTPVVPMLTWILASPLIVLWLGAVTACMSGLLASNAALIGALPGTLSTKSFTA
jgi:hypothetical protein